MSAAVPFRRSWLWLAAKPRRSTSNRLQHAWVTDVGTAGMVRSLCGRVDMRHETELMGSALSLRCAHCAQEEKDRS